MFCGLRLCRNGTGLGGRDGPQAPAVTRFFWDVGEGTLPQPGAALPTRSLGAVSQSLPPDWDAVRSGDTACGVLGRMEGMAPHDCLWGSRGRQPAGPGLPRRGGVGTPRSEGGRGTGAAWVAGHRGLSWAQGWGRRQARSKRGPTRQFPRELPRCVQWGSTGFLEGPVTCVLAVTPGAGGARRVSSRLPSSPF